MDRRDPTLDRGRANGTADIFIARNPCHGANGLKLHVAYICGEYPRATDTFIQREVAALREAGHEVSMISVRRPPEREQGGVEQLHERNRTHYLLPCSPWRLAMAHLTALGRSPVRYLSVMWMALSIRSPGVRALVYQLFYFAEAGLAAAQLKRDGVTHIHNHAPDSSGYVTMLAARMGGFTYSLTIHGFGILSEPKRWRLKEKLEGALFCICVSWHARSQAMLWSDPRVWDRFHVVHCGIEPAAFQSREHTGHGRRLLFVGRLDHVKGVPMLLDALELLRRSGRDVQLDIVGDGPQRSLLEQRARSAIHAGHVTFHGYKSQQELRQLFDACDVMVMSSFSEGVPVVLMEAMSRGLPVVAPRITGVPELVESGVTGRLFTPGNPGALAEAVEEVLVDPEKRTAYAGAAMAFVCCEFNLEREVRRFVAVMQHRLEGKTVDARPKVSSEQ